MPLAPLQALLAAAQSGGYAVCYCESWNLESVQAVLEAAVRMRAPAIVGFNGGFLAHESRQRPEDLLFYASFLKALQCAPVPVSFLLNESTELAQIRDAIHLGFNAVMPDNEGMEENDYRRFVEDVVAIARPAGVFVEAQVGQLACGAGQSSGRLTDPGAAAEFVNATGIDALAIAVGNVHILTEGKCRLDVGAVERIRERVDIPLVLHGGTGLADDDLQAAVRAGVTKLNFGTGLKQAYLEAVRTALAEYRYPLSPHEFLGVGGPKDILVAGRNAVRDKVCELIRFSGSAGKAE